MEIINLEKIERIKMSSIISDFRDVHDETSKIQKEMEALQKTSTFLIEKLNLIRDREKSLISDLELKYGKGSLNPFDLTYNKE